MYFLAYMARTQANTGILFLFLMKLNFYFCEIVLYSYLEQKG